jgi:hypothetical protein
MKSVRVVWPLLLAALVLTTGTPSTYAWSSAQATVSVFGGASSDYGWSIAVDSSGNVYTTGYFQGTVDFDPGAGTSNLTSAGSSDVFVSKLDSSGALVWAKSFGGASSDLGYSIAVDSSGNVYTTGYFNGTADFDPGAGTSNLTSAGGNDVFVSKLDSSGALVWAKGFGGASFDLGYSIAVDSSGNVYTTGYFNDTVDFDPGAGTSNLTSAGSSDVFVSKLDSSGALVWAKSFGGASGDIGRDIAVDSSGNIYTTGYFNGTVDFDPGAGTSNLTSAGGNDVFVSKLDSSGALVWAKSFGGASSDLGISIAVDSSGNIYTTGYFNGTADFDPGAGTSNLTSAGGNDVFVSKLDSSGNLVWAKGFGGASNDLGYYIAVDSSGNVYTTGYFEGTVDFDPGAGTSNLTSAGGNDVFVSKLDSSGALVWAKSFGGTSFDSGYSIAVDSSGNIYTTGYFNGTADFDPGAGTSNLTSAGGADIFVLKLTSSGEALTVALVDVPPIRYVPPMLPIIAPSIAVNSGVITCTAGEYSRAATSVVFSLFVDGNHLATNFSATGDYLPSWLAPWASASTVQRTASLTSASWDIGVVGNGSRASCSTLAYSQHATGLISSDSISLP